MSEAETIFCAKIPSGQVFKSFIKCCIVSSQPSFSVSKQGIRATNRTVEGNIFIDAFLHAKEIALRWNKNFSQMNFKIDSKALDNLCDGIQAKNELRISMTCILDRKMEQEEMLRHGSFRLNVSVIQGKDDQAAIRYETVYYQSIVEMKVTPFVSDNTIEIPIETLKAMLKVFRVGSSPNTYFIHWIEEEKEGFEDSDGIVIRSTKNGNNIQTFSVSDINSYAEQVDNVYSYNQTDLKILQAFAACSKDSLVHIMRDETGQHPYLLMQTRLGSYGEVSAYIQKAT